jgi:hypothetical protein
MSRLKSDSRTSQGRSRVLILVPIMIICTHTHMLRCTCTHTCTPAITKYVYLPSVSCNHRVPLLCWTTIWNDYHPHIPFLEQLYLLGLHGEWARGQHHPDVHYSGQEQLYNHQDENQGLTAFGFDLERDTNIQLIFHHQYKNHKYILQYRHQNYKFFKLLVNISNGYDNHEDYCFLEHGRYLLTLRRETLLTPKMEAVYSFILYSISDTPPDYSVTSKQMTIFMITTEPQTSQMSMMIKGSLTEQQWM